MAGLGKVPLYADYLDKNDKQKGFSMVYGGGDLCESEWMQRKTQFDFYCDPSIDFEVRTLEVKDCHYTFKIYTSKACESFYSVASGSTNDQ